MISRALNVLATRPHRRSDLPVRTVTRWQWQADPPPASRIDAASPQSEAGSADLIQIQRASHHLLHMAMIERARWGKDVSEIGTLQEIRTVTLQHK
jgi:hypothetical protein